MAYITKEDLLNSHVGTDFSTYDNGADDDTNYLNILCQLATDMVESFTNRSFISGEYIEQGHGITDTDGNLFITTKQMPVSEIVYLKVKNKANIDWITLEKNLIDLRAKEGYIYYSTGTRFERIIADDRYYMSKRLNSEFIYEISYKTELPEEIPALIKHACVLVAGELVKVDLISKATGTPSSSGDITSFISGNYSVNFADKINKNSAFQGYGMIPAQAQFILSKYKRYKQNAF